MIPALSAKTETNIKLPLSFIIYSLIAFCFSQIAMVFSTDMLVDGVYRYPTLWMAMHLLLLGWALMVAMGAMYQLVPVAFLVAIWSEKFGFVQFGVSALGITGLSLALGFFPEFLVPTAILTLLGIVMFFIQMWMTMKKQKQKNIMTLFVGTALLCLFLTILFGGLLSFNLSGLNLGIDHLAILKSHILLGVFGWFSLLIFGFSYKMVPMFSLAHGFSMKWSRYVYIFYILGLVVTLLSFSFDLNVLLTLGLLLLFIGFSLFVLHIKKILDKRIKKVLDIPFKFSLVAIVIGWFVHFASVVLILFTSVNQKTVGIILYAYIFGWIVFSIMGYLFKIVPFLWWTYKYSQVIGKTNVPALKNMMNDRAGKFVFITLTIALVVIVISMTLNLSWLLLLSQSILAICSLYFTWLILSVLKR